MVDDFNILKFEATEIILIKINKVGNIYWNKLDIYGLRIATVMRSFSILPGALRGCVAFRDQTSFSRLNSSGLILTKGTSILSYSALSSLINSH